LAFEFDGQTYTKASTHQKEWGTRLIDELEVQPDEHILDLGCGDGVLTAKLAELVPQGLVIGIDASQGMIDAAKTRERLNLRFKRMDINHLDFEAEFDLVFSNAALHWIKDHHQLLAGIFKSLKKGGRLRFNFAGDGNCSYFFKVIRAVMSQSEYAAYFRAFGWPWYMPTVEKYQQLVNQFPFQEVQVWGENADRYFPDVEAMVRWIDQPSIVPFLECVADRDKERFRNRVVEQMVKETRQGDGRCFETFRRVNVFAKK
jgi:trans-aconitate 2-methyltransferase